MLLAERLVDLGAKVANEDAELGRHDITNLMVSKELSRQMFQCSMILTVDQPSLHQKP
jgi:hypothetical protein